MCCIENDDVAGGTSFAAASPQTWNSLLALLSSVDNYERFIQLLTFVRLRLWPRVTSCSWLLGAG